MMRSIQNLLVVLCVLLATPMAYASPASPIQQFRIAYNTSAWYNPTLPSPLTAFSAVYQVNWDFVPNGQLASNRTNGGGWVAWMVFTDGGYVNGTLLSNYQGLPGTYFDVFPLTDSSGIQWGTLDIYYCNPCNGGGTADASATSIFGLGFIKSNWYSRLFIQ